MRKFLLLIVTIGLSASLWSQNVIPCYTDEHQHELLEKNPELAAQYEQQKQLLLDYAADNIPPKEGTEAVLTIPVVFHVIYDTPYDNIPKSQILDALRILNEDFRKQNPDAGSLRPIFQNVQADVEVEFALAKKDPQGNCTDGITRMQSPLSVMASPRNQVKNLVRWNTSNYLNIWVVNSIESSSSTSGIVLGYANFPWMAASTDGIVIRHDALGTVGTSNYDGRTLTHEVGHYLGLLHTFQSGCSTGDGISDTPPVSSASFGCNLNSNTCSNDSPDFPDMIENFMDYSDGACQNTFTVGQKSVMVAVLNNANYRKNLVSASNLDATGVTNPPACIANANFTFDEEVVCMGESVQFLDETEGGDPTTYSWSFNGGSPSTSSDQNPIISYNTPGVYDVTLTVANPAGTTTKTMKRVVTVRADYSDYKAEWHQDFEAPASINTDISIATTYDTTQFKISNIASSSGAQSLLLENFNSAEPLDLDYMISPNIETLFGKDITLTFDYAYAQIVGNELDRLRVLISTDCGQTWSILRSYVGFTLRTTNSPVSGFFTPGSTEWKSSTINLNGYEDKGPIFLKWEFKADGGNNLYIDNINITSSNISLDENQFSSSLSLYPNPAKNSVSMSFGTELNEQVDVLIADISGKPVKQFEILKGTSDHTIQNLNLPAGVYTLSIKRQNQTVVKKLIIE
jgi:PKD repeat protein